MLMATINSSIILISLPAIFRGIGINPLSPCNVGYLLWLMMGYMLVTAVLVVSLGRLGDMLGRVRIYNAGFAVFSVASIILALDPMRGGGGALWLVLWRLLQGVGGAMLFANASAIIADAFPVEQRGLAIGINQVAAIAGSFIGLIAGGLLSVVDWRLVFWVSVPVGVIGTVWAYKSLKDNGRRVQARIDWWGNITFAVGLTAVLAAIVYGIQPYGGHTMGWTAPKVIVAFVAGIVLLAASGWIELHSDSPMFNLRLFKIRAFATGGLAGLLAAISRGGMQFMLIIWLQGIWLPLHGYDFSQTPLWAGIYLVPLTVGFLIAAPLSGVLSDKFGPKAFTVGGALLTAVSFGLLIFVPVNFSYWEFALVIALNGFGSGLFFSPHWAEMMNSVPADRRGAAGGMIATFQNSAFVLSIGIFFTLMVAGLSSKLPAAMFSGLTAQGVPAATAAPISHLPPIGVLFASFLGYNPIQQLLGPLLHNLSPSHATYVTGRQFFPHLITAPFHSGLGVAFGFAIAANVIAAIASVLTGKRTKVPAARESLGYELAAVAGEGGFEPGELVPGIPEESTQPPDQPD